jgi:hypothetical protein
MLESRRRILGVRAMRSSGYWALRFKDDDADHSTGQVVLIGHIKVLGKEHFKSL